MDHVLATTKGGLIALAALLLASSAAIRAQTTVTTLVGTGTGGYSASQVNNPYGLVIGPDGALYFCDLDNQRIRRLDRITKQMTTVAGTGERGYRGDGGPAVDAALNMPHELRFDHRGDLYVAERDNHVIRKIDRHTGVINTVAGTGVAGFSGDGGAATRAQLRQPHSLLFDRDGTLLICDIGNHRIRRLNLQTGVIDTYAGTGEQLPTGNGAPVRGTPLKGPRTLALAPNGDLYIALREGNAIYRINRETQTFHHVAGTGEQGYTGDEGPAVAARLGGPKGLALASDGSLVCGRYRESCDPAHRPEHRSDSYGLGHRPAWEYGRHRSAEVPALTSAWCVRRRRNRLGVGQRSPSHPRVAIVPST